MDTSAKKPTYVVVTPVRNEAERFAQTVASMVTQTHRPLRWVIVDDGSTDTTGALADQAARDHAWIRVIHRPDRGARKQGTGVIESFYEGFELVRNEPWDFVGKLDGDLSFEPDYFEKCFAHFAKNPKLGIGGARVYSPINGQLIDDAPGDPPFHVRGATKIYRRETWDAIGGLLRAPGWDTLDELKANMLGWQTYSFRELPVRQLKPTGSADGTWKNWFKNGRANYIVGYHPLFMLAKCARRSVRAPFGIAAGGLLCGFVSGYLKGIPQVPDAPLIQYLRQEQMNRLLGRPSLWN